MTFYAIMMFYFVLTRHEVENVVLLGCNDGWLSLREFGNDSIICWHDKFQKVTWTISPPDNNAPIFSGSCPSLGAPCLTNGDIILTRKEASSDLTIVANYRKYGNKIVTCKAGSAYSCHIRIVHSANHSDCHINMDDSTLSGYCHVTQLYSSNNVYTCQWNIRLTAEGASIMMPSTLYAHNQHGQPYYRGICAFSYPRPADGEYYLSLTVDPGLQDTHIATITIPSHQVPDAKLPVLPVMVDGTETLSLMCVISPETTRPYTWSGVQCNEGNGKEMCTFTPGSIHTENAVTCLGNFSQSSYNGLTLEARFDFNNTNPPDQPVISGYTMGQVLELGHRLEMVCTVHGGSPKVSSIDFTCTALDDGEDTSNETSVSSSVIIRSVSEADDQRLCNCSARWLPQPSLVLSTSVTLLVARTPSIVELSLNNVRGSLTLSATEHETAILRCGANGFPEPSIRVVRVDTGQPLKVNTSHTSGQDENVQQYTLTTSARCQDAAIYRCEANNSKGTDQQTVTLYVNCTPRLTGDSQTLGLPTNLLVVSNQESSIDLIAFPVPSTRSSVFLGTATPTVDSFEGFGDSSTALGVQCQPDDETIYISRCTVRVSDSAANGFYRVTLGNQVGSAAFLIHLDLPQQEVSSSVPVPAIAGGVGGAVVIIVMIIIVVVIVSRRKQELNKRKKGTTKADDEEFEEHINPVYDMEDTHEDDLKDKPKPTAFAWRVSPQSHLMNDLEDGTPVEDDRDAGYSSLSMGRNQQPTTFSSPDDDTYSSVDDDGPNIQAATNNRPQFNDQDAGDYAVVGAEGEERSTEVPRGDVYAVVDKTKKQQQSSDSTTPSLSAESSGNSGQTGDVYAVIDKTKKKRQTSDNTSSSPAASAQTTNTGIAGPNGDVYAQVNKSLRGKAGTDTSQQKPTVKPKLAPKPKPALKPKPSVSTVGEVTKDGNSVSGAGDEYDPYEDIEFSSPESPPSVTDAQNMTTMQATETEYNTLRFDNNNPARETAADDTEYSHLGSV